MKKLLSGCIIFLVLPLNILAQGNENNPVTLSSAFHTYSLRPPDGWYCESNPGKGSAGYANFYQKGKDFLTSPAVIYVRSFSLNTSDRKTVADVIRLDSAFYHEHYPEIRPQTEKPIRINEVLQATCKAYSDKTSGTYDLYAYISAGNAVVVITLTSDSSIHFERSLRTLDEMVRSYQFIALKPSPQHK